jgi:DeoR/GlpR family transcriptional regulator of sugar metabolism
MIQDNNQISLTQLAKKLSVTKMTVIRDIENLKAKGLIERIGLPKGGYWKVTEKC